MSTSIDARNEESFRAAFTAGPWSVAANPYDQPVPWYRGLICTISHNEHGHLAVVTGEPNTKSGHAALPHQWKGNARLIASAPELLAALEMVRDADNDCARDGLPTIPPLARAKIDAAIAKAVGQGGPTGRPVGPSDPTDDGTGLLPIYRPRDAEGR